MKRRFTILTAAFMLLAFLAIPMGMMGQTTVTFTAGTDTGETSVTKDGITVSMSTMSRTDNYRCYANTDMTIESTVGNITNVELTCTGSGNANYGPGKFSLTEGYTGTYSYSGYIGTWTGSAEEISLTASAQVRMTEIVVTVGGSAPTSFTVTYDANGGTGTMTDENSPYEAGALVTVMDNVFTRDNYVFEKWNTSFDGLGTDYDEGDQFEINANTTLYAQWTEQSSGDDHWVLTDLADLTSTDVFVIVGNNGSDYAMSNNNGTGSAPSAVSVTVDGTEITSTVAATIQWNISGDATNGYKFYPNGSTTTWLYCTDQNNGVRVGTTTGSNYDKFKIQNDYIYNIGRSAYLGIYNSSDWRRYTSINNNIKDQTFAFYKKVTGGVVPPSITAANVDIEYNATSGSITYTVNNEVNGGTMSASTTADWITLGNNFDSPIAFTCTANEAGTARTATVTLTYTYNRETVSKDVTVTQAAAPVVYNTMQTIFDKATEVGSTATSVNIALQNWVVSGVSTNGKNVFVTDGTKGFVIFNTDGNMGFAVGNILSGTVSCKVQLYHGFAEITELNSSTEGISIATGGTVTEANIAMAELAGVNTSALVSYDNLTCSVTTSGNNTFYNLSDGTTTIQVYNAIYTFGTLVEGKTYNITGIYQQYNNTKEILPRSANDIEEVVITTPSITVNPDMVELDAEEHDGTLALAYENLEISNMTDFGIQYYDAEGEEATTLDWIEVLVAEQDPAEGEGYVVSYYMMENEGEARTAYFKVFALGDEDFVYSNLVTISQAAPVVPPTPGDWVLTSLADLTEDDVFVIVGADADTDATYALPNNGGSNAPLATAITVVEETLSGEPAVELQWNLTGNATDGYTFYPNGDTETWLYCSTTAASGSNNNIKVGTGSRKVFVLDEDNYLVTNDNNVDRYLSIYFNNGVAQDWRGYINTTSAVAISFYKKVEAPVTETYTLTIEGYDTSEKGGYYLIASPVVEEITPSADNGFITNAYDLYYFNQAGDNEGNEWINYKAGAFNIESGKGYLYASQEDTQLIFSGTPYSGEGVFSLVYSEEDNTTMKGWNLVGNPFAETAYVDRDYYTMNSDGSQIIAATNEDGINRMEGVFVKATGPEQSVTFSTTAPESKSATLALNLSQGRGVIDRAIVRFDEGLTLPKFQINRNSTKLYILQDNEEFAVVNSTAQGEMPVSFKAAENGRYTLSINNESVEMNYLHLIDNMTGTDIDLLQTPSYSFDANTTDYAQRFKLVFATGNADDYFAFFSNGNLVINNEGQATLQVVDITGRMISNTTISGCESIDLHNMNAGVYMIRLINGNDVKVQKVVVR